MYLKKKLTGLYKKLIFRIKKKINLDNKKIEIVTLNELFNYFGTDKGTAIKNPYSKDLKKSDNSLMGHGYAKFYEIYLARYKDKEIKLLEIGTWEGASIASFYYYFKNAIIFCIDRNYKLIFYSKRINFFYCDTTKINQINNFKNFLIKKKTKNFDIIIDDGSHIYSNILNNFKNFFEKVVPGGYYVIEDFNHYKYHPELDDTTIESQHIDDILNNIRGNLFFESDFLSRDFQSYCFDNIEEIKIHKGIQKDSFIVFIKKKN